MEDENVKKQTKAFNNTDIDGKPPLKKGYTD